MHNHNQQRQVSSALTHTSLKIQTHVSNNRLMQLEKELQLGHVTS
jgi:hypothetical protein